jgi:hypothetical protein
MLFLERCHRSRHPGPLSPLLHNAPLDKVSDRQYIEDRKSKDGTGLIGRKFASYD